MPEVVIVGGGLSGLACALALSSARVDCLVLEASDAVGGRARTDRFEGFLLDRGFQVMLTAYPEAHRFFDYRTLALRRFLPGALVRYQGRFHRLADPVRQPGDLLNTVTSPLAGLSDKVAIARLWLRTRSPYVQSFQQPQTTTADALQRAGFTPRFVETFLRPFFGGIFLERELRTSSRMFEFVFKMFADGYAALPWQGMGALAQQLASRLPAGTLRLNSPVKEVGQQHVVLQAGEAVAAKFIVVAADQASSARLLQQPESPSSRSTVCLYFSAPRAPIREPILVLNGEHDGPVNHLCVPSAVSPSYAPAGSHLISASVVGEPEQAEEVLRTSVLAQMREWFGPQVQGWKHLRSYKIPHALPDQSPSSGGVSHASVRLGRGSYVCGDYRDSASINGALLSGRRAAEAILADRAS